jgi:hypothetical protein
MLGYETEAAKSTYLEQGLHSEGAIQSQLEKRVGLFVDLEGERCTLTLFLTAPRVSGFPA